MIPKNLKTDFSPRSDNFNVMNTNKFIPAAKIKVIGVGGAGCNAIKRMIEMGIEGVEFWAFNTDLQVLKQIHADGIIQLGVNITRGLGAGMSSEVGRQAAEESLSEIEVALTGSDMVFITAGMGGGTGTGASPVVAEVAKRLGILTVGVVTKPFKFEGMKRSQIAEEGIDRLKANSDAVIVVPNERLLQMVAKNTSVKDAFMQSDEVLHQAVQGISDLINFPGEINVDFADVRAIMSNAGTALMGMGRSSGNNGERAKQAALMAIDSPLLEMSIHGARGILLNVQGGKSLSLNEISEAADIIHSQVDPEAKIIFGTSIDANLNDEVRVTVIATGFSNDKEPKDDLDANMYNYNTANNRPYGYTGNSASVANATYQAPAVGTLTTTQSITPVASVAPSIQSANQSKPVYTNNGTLNQNTSGMYQGNVNSNTQQGYNQPQQSTYPSEYDIPAFLRRKN